MQPQKNEQNPASESTLASRLPQDALLHLPLVGAEGAAPIEQPLSAAHAASLMTGLDAHSRAPGAESVLSANSDAKPIAEQRLEPSSFESAQSGALAPAAFSAAVSMPLATLSTAEPKKILAKIQSDLARRNWKNATIWLRYLDANPTLLNGEMCRQVVASAIAKGARSWCEAGEQKVFFDTVEKTPFWVGHVRAWICREDGALPMGQCPEMLHYLARVMKEMPIEDCSQIWFRTAMAGAKMASPGTVWAALRELGPEEGFTEGQKRAILKSWVHGALAAPLLTAQAHYPATLNAMESLGLAHEMGYLNQITACLKDLPPPDAATVPEKQERSAAFVAMELIERIPEHKAQEAANRARYWVELTQWRAAAHEVNWEVWTPVKQAAMRQIKKAQEVFPQAVGGPSKMSVECFRDSPRFYNGAAPIENRVADTSSGSKARGPGRFSR